MGLPQMKLLLNLHAILIAVSPVILLIGMIVALACINLNNSVVVPAIFLAGLVALPTAIFALIARIYVACSVPRMMRRKLELPKCCWIESFLLIYGVLAWSVFLVLVG